MNKLQYETSPYLLQHATNPVDWYAWGDEALQKAQVENKPLLISIGYSACHWCHVMEDESFTNPELANLMNENFICIKIDREERPDLDQLYMHAVQLINGHGGWPMNVFTLPDGKPFFGGTYYRPDQWKSLLLNISRVYRERKNEILRQAAQIHERLQEDDWINHSIDYQPYTLIDIGQSIRQWKSKWDLTDGGTLGAPKFPLPVNLQMLLRYYSLSQETDVLDYVNLSLIKMAHGGIYDQLGGGFSRYSTDSQWKVPHFEKMLYDNALLISVYTEAWSINQNPTFKRVVYETIEFVKRELTSQENLFYSALDADSEGEEGKFYTWTKAEIDAVLDDASASFSDHYGVNGIGLWENGQNILMRLSDQEDSEIREKLRLIRENRIRPGLDDKMLTSWNALMIKACFQAGKVFRNDEFIDLGINALTSLLDKMLSENSKLFHRYAKGQSGIPGFLEDYATLIDALLELPAEKAGKWEGLAEKLTESAIGEFYDQQDGYFYFSPESDTSLVSRNKEVLDNVTAASNSVMAGVLYKLGLKPENEHYSKMAERMLNGMTINFLRHPSSFANWGILAMDMINPLDSFKGIEGPHCDENGVCNI
jgi:uncharacterized protein YyaL (SSP411 family)